MVKLVWAEISRDDLNEIFVYISVDSKRYAAITVNKIYKRAQKIAINPYLGRIVPELNQKFIREVLSGNYRIVYRIVNNLQVDILRIYHSSRLLISDTLK